jgi:hypothetical protein
MLKTPDSGTNSTTKCEDTTEENTQSTLDEITKKKSNNATRITSRRRESGMSVSKGTSNEPPPRIIASELNHWIFKHGEAKYQADDTEHLFEWLQFVNKWANVKKTIDWEDLEERVYFLNMLYAWCDRSGIPFPLEESSEKTNEALNISEDKTASEGSRKETIV